ncbi:MAG: PAS domain S-box protein [Verrucomicrobia bacterium]|nr:PAS domain S-box protein [Verrucomicrobiota bacterium]
MNTERLHLLIVEDEEAHVEAIRRAFDADGANVEVHVAGTLREYSELVATRPLDIVLMDLNLPDGRAVEILTHPPENGPFPVIVMTAFGNQQIVVEVMKAGALDYVVKSPEAFATLPRAVERLLREWKLLQSHKRAEAVVRAERQRFSDVLDQLPAYLVLLTPDYHVPFANRFFRERFGEAHGRRCYEYLFNRTEPCEICETYSVLKTNAPHHWQWTGPDHRNYDIYDFPFKDTDGSPLIMEVGLDVTERKRATEALVAIKERLQNTLSSMTQGYYAIDRDWRVVAVNAAAEKHFGKPAAELIGGTLEQATQGRIPDNVREGIQQVMTSGQPQQFEVESKVRPGTWAIDYIYPRDGGVEVYFTDITERKLAEEALEEEAVRRRILIDGSKDGIVILDADGKVFESNRRYAEMLGYSLEEMGRLHIWDWDAQWTREQILEMIGSLDETGDHFETRQRRKDGTIFDVEISSNAALCAGRKLIFAVCRDITERKRAAEALRKQTAELRARNKELERFNNASVGRELRMIELKQEINQLCQQAGLPPRYPSNSARESERIGDNTPPTKSGQP